MAETKRLLRVFTISDYEEEEAFLREQHKQGWKFKKYTIPVFYTFEKCEPEDVVYRLDFSDASGTERGIYQQMFTDYGWEYLFDSAGFSYFRKNADAEDRNTEIFNDDNSRYELMKKIFRSRMLPILLLMAVCVIPQFCRAMADAGFSFALKAFWMAIFVLYILIIAHCGRGFLKLHRKYGEK